MKKAFTLAEVLITLTIIGVIAAITIPNLMHKHFENEAVSKAKQTYGLISNAWIKYKAENNCHDMEECFSVVASTAVSKSFTQMEPIFLEFVKTLNVKEYNTNSHRNLKLYGYKTKMLDGTSQNAGFLYSSSNILLLNNGTTVSFDWGSAYSRSLTFTIDINGAKGPNQIGKDTFRFGMLQDAEKGDPIIPEWTISEWWSGESYLYGECGINYGSCKTYCAEKSDIPERHVMSYVLKNGKLPDLSKLQ